VPDIRDATMEDVGAVFDLLTVRSRAAFGVSELSRALVEADFRREGIDRWVAAEDGVIVGYAHLTGDHALVVAATDPVAGDALVGRAERRACERGFHVLNVTAVPEDEPLWALVVRNGFAHHHDVLRMWRTLEGELPQPRWPDGVTVRTYGDDDDERVHALLDTAYSAWHDNYVPQPHLEWLAFMTDHEEFDPTMWFLVERGDDLVACALHWKEHQRRGWVKDLVVRDSERGAGLGTALLHHGFREYAQRDVKRVGLKVDSDNPTGAPRLYERVGFEVDQRYAIWLKTL
jgi:mycothiol synthase